MGSVMHTHVMDGLTAPQAQDGPRPRMPRCAPSPPPTGLPTAAWPAAPCCRGRILGTSIITLIVGAVHNHGLRGRGRNGGFKRRWTAESLRG